MSGFTMPAFTYPAPSGTVETPVDHALSPDAGTQLRCSWTATGLVSFTGHFRNKITNALIGSQSFSNDTVGNWFFGDSSFNGSTPFVVEMDSITANGHSITLTFSVDSGTPYSGVKVRRAGVWRFTPIYVRRSGGWVFSPAYVRRSGAWALAHK